MHELGVLVLVFLLARVIIVAPAGGCIFTALHVVDRTAIFFVLGCLEQISTDVMGPVCIFDGSLGFARSFILHKAGILVAGSLLGHFIFTLS